MGIWNDMGSTVRVATFNVFQRTPYGCTAKISVLNMIDFIGINKEIHGINHFKGDIAQSVQLGRIKIYLPDSCAKLKSSPFSQLQNITDFIFLQDDFHNLCQVT